jgi:TPR repeat protein
MIPLRCAFAALALGVFTQASPALAQSEEAARLHEACVGGKQTACIHLGILHRHGMGAPVDDREAVSLYVSACEQGYALACGFVGDMAYLGAGVRQNVDHGQILMRGACKRGNEWSCETLRRHGLIRRRPQS